MQQSKLYKVNYKNFEIFTTTYIFVVIINLRDDEKKITLK